MKLHAILSVFLSVFVFGVPSALVAAEGGRRSAALTIVVPFTQGGPTDEIGRVLADALARDLKRKVVVRNVRGAGGTLGAEQVARAKPDGNTLLLSNMGHAASATLHRKLRYDPVGDFEPVGLVADVPMTIVRRRDLPAETFSQLVGARRSGGGELSYGHAGLGSASHLCGLMLMKAFELNFVSVPYQGTQEALLDLAGRHIDLMCDQTSNTLKAIEAGQVRPLAVTSGERLAVLPEVQSLGESADKGFELVVWHGLYAPKGTPMNTVERLSAALGRALADPELAARFVALAVRPAPAAEATPEALRSRLETEIVRWRPLIEKAGQYAD